MERTSWVIIVLPTLSRRFSLTKLHELQGMICNILRQETKTYLQFQAWVLLVDALYGGCLSREANEGLHQVGYLSFRVGSVTNQKGFLNVKM